MLDRPYIDGQYADVIHLQNENGVTASLMDVGATWLSFTAPIGNEQRELLLRSRNMTAFLKQEAYLGGTIGRFANRIAKGEFVLNGEAFFLPVNNGENSLHGGDVGFDKRRWKVVDKQANSVIFSLYSADGEQGFPGNMNVEVRYQLNDDNAMTISYKATSDKACPVNLTNHAYFNLSGLTKDGIALQHELLIAAEHYLPVNEALIPTGQMKSVKQTHFDFTRPKRVVTDFLKDKDQEIASGYDHCFVFKPYECDGKKTIATLASPQDDLIMRVKTTKPSMQVYTGNFLAGIEGYDKYYQNNDGIALETQYFPDAPNQEQWLQRNPVLQPGDVYQHTTVYELDF
ncbi:galactose-1-epimerase [Vibrio sp. FNV 38]|nr:galactose-1-epimerase [Vibrio sp. FNV 38]